MDTDSSDDSFERPRANRWSNIQASGEARQHNGHVYNSHRYTISQRRPDEARREKDRNKAFVKAASEGQMKRMETLLEKGVDSDFVGRDGLTALHHASFGGREDMVDLLLSRDVDINPRSHRYGTPLVLAAVMGRQHVARMLLDAKATVHAAGSRYGSVLHAACAGGDAAIVQALLRRGASLSAMKRVCLDELADPEGKHHDEGGDRSFVVENFSECQALHVAAACGKDVIVDILIGAGADVNEVAGNWVRSTRSGHSPKDRPIIWGQTALMMAAEYGHDAVIRKLMMNGVRGDEITVGGETALGRAAQHLQDKSLRALLDGGVDPDYQSSIHIASHTALWEVVDAVGEEADQYACAATLLAKGANPSACKDDDGVTPLHRAVDNDDYDLAQLLIRHGANVNARDRKGTTPLEEAMGVSPEIRIVKLLISAGANVRMKTSEGKSVLDDAKERDKGQLDSDEREAVKIVLKAGRRWF